MELYKTKKLFEQQRKLPTKQKSNTDLDKIFANDISDKGLVPKMYKELIELNVKKINNLNNYVKFKNKIKLKKKYIENLNRHFSKKTYRWPIRT